MKKLITLILTILLIACCNASVFAMPFNKGKTGKIEVTVASNSVDVNGVKIELYRIGEFIDKNYEFKLAVPFENSGISLEFDSTVTDTEINDRINTLCEYIKENNIQPYTDDITVDGKVIFDNLQNGLYLLTGPKSIVIEGNNAYYYSPQSVFIAIPSIKENEYVFDIEIVNKYTKTVIGYDDPDNPLLELEVIKKFDDAGYQDKRPETVVVDLYKDNTLYETVELNIENEFSYTWEGLAKFENDEPVIWEIVEREAKGYTASYESNGTKVIITNKYNPPTPDKPELPNTGVLWWPVPVMLAGGLILVLTGIILDKKHEA